MTPCPKPTARPKGRKKGLQRTRIRRKRARRIDRETSAEAHYRAWVHEQPCEAYSPSCFDTVEQAHLRDMTGLGRKESGFKTIPLCSWHHRAYDQAGGVFRNWTLPERKSWFRQRIADAHKRFEIEHGCKPEEWRAA